MCAGQEEEEEGYAYVRRRCYMRVSFSLPRTVLCEVFVQTSSCRARVSLAMTNGSCCLPLLSARAVIDPSYLGLSVFYRARTRKEGVLIHAIVSLQLICGERACMAASSRTSPTDSPFRPSAYPPLRPLLPFSTSSYDIPPTYLTHFDL